MRALVLLPFLALSAPAEDASVLKGAVELFKSPTFKLVAEPA